MIVLVTLPGSVVTFGKSCLGAPGSEWGAARAWGNDNQRQASFTVAVHLHLHHHRHIIGLTHLDVCIH